MVRLVKYLVFNTTSLLLLFAMGCKSGSESGEENAYDPGTFGYDHKFLKDHYENLIVLKNDDSAMAVVSPELQGRVMTSTANGMDGQSFGWINHELIASGKIQPQMHAVGGEERIWLGPEGGQFSYYFSPGEEFILKNWQVPKEIDTEPFEVVSSSEVSAHFRKKMSLVNYSGNPFEILVERTINLLNREEQREYLGIELSPSVKSVAIESKNTLINQGQNTWDEQYGMPSIWILSMLNPSPETVVMIPFKNGPEEALGPVVNDVYFGKIGVDRLQIDEGIIYFRADGQKRGKIGVSPQRAQPVAGSYDAINQVLTIAMFTIPAEENSYVNSLWELQDDPFSGDVINAYNDGPQEDGSMLGPFYEIESSSPAANLAKGEQLTHYHRTFHFVGDFDELSYLAKSLLGVELKELTSVFQ